MTKKSRTKVRLAASTDHETLSAFRQALWPKKNAAEHHAVLTGILTGKPLSTLPWVLFVAETEKGLAGFIEVGLRSHAEGCDPRRPVGYVEGWYVAAKHRKEGLGRILLKAAEDWARVQGCTQMASDTWMDNPEGQRAHEALGFEVVDRCVHYRKAL